MAEIQPYSEQELEAIKAFLTEVNNERSEFGLSPVGTTTAVKFLTARKFDIDRALLLYKSYLEKCRVYCINDMSPYEDPLRQELLSGKFTILDARDPSGAAIAMITARMHQPEVTSHSAVITGMVFQLDQAIKSPLTQRSGLVLLYDMSNSSYKNFDFDLSQKILELLKGGYPARLKSVFIISPPLWFKAVLLILSSFLREKIRERIEILSIEQLQDRLPIGTIPKSLGGKLNVDHFSWLNQCMAAYSEKVGANEEPPPPPPPPRATTQTSSTNQTPSQTEVLPQGSRAVVAEDYPKFGEPAMRIMEFLAHVKGLGRRGIRRQYLELRNMPVEGTFLRTKLRANLRKNRYTDVLCVEETRVPLSPVDEDDCSDYIHANFTDGYRQHKAFIATQGPLPNTTSDFWRMVWEQGAMVIVMITRCMERGRVKCRRYWPEDGDCDDHVDLRVQHVETQEYEDHVERIFTIDHVQTGQSRTIIHFQMTSWPDFGVPSSAESCLHILGLVRQAQASAVLAMGPSWKGHPSGPPIVVHCSAGIGRTGTFCTLDINVSRLQHEGVCEIVNTVKYLRTQRAHMIQTPEQYEFCHLAVLEFALSLPSINGEDKQRIKEFLHAWRSTRDDDSESD
ncbi:tyrosine-protein phosphatase non-receptor type 9 isoform X1 [Nematostella vectensis]|uniref:tyrosine-protein phosphatase non-receptor type 9 isoform X1 n=1 Tax=Nematostella vectensis TaxID=45351 RepID=UPI002077071D|nr:tyrosine-protein phosphatase non-receptor type 9 isoform X1 [Nematostella vectensis]